MIYIHLFASCYCLHFRITKNGFSSFCAFVREFNASLKIPENLSGLGVANVDIKKLTEEALKDPSCGGNPIELNSQNVLALIKKII